MKRLCLILTLVLFVGQAPAHALIVDSAVAAMAYAEEQAFHAFMKLKVVEEVMILKQNYEASVRYFNEFKQLNSGRGIFQNVASQIKTAQRQLDDSFKTQFQQKFVQSYNSNTAVDQFFHSLDQAIASNIKYAGDEAANLISNRKVGEKISGNAEGLSPKDAANLTAKAQGIQIQMMAQTHEDNLRVIQLLSMQLAGQARQEGSQSRFIESMRRGVKSRAPGFQEQQEPDQGGNQ